VELSLFRRIRHQFSPPKGGPLGREALFEDQEMGTEYGGSSFAYNKPSLPLSGKKKKSSELQN